MARWMLDFDDTLAATDQERINKANLKYNKRYTLDDLTSWYPDFPEYILRFMWGKECFQHNQFLKEVQPINGAINTVTALQSMGHQFLICSDRPPHLKESTREWLDRWGFDMINLRLTRYHDSLASDVEGALTKIQAVQAHRLTHIVEDAPHHALALSQKPYVEKVYLLDKPYNQGVQSDKIIRVKDWWHIGDLEGTWYESSLDRKDAER